MGRFEIDFWVFFRKESGGMGWCFGGGVRLD